MKLFLLSFLIVFTSCKENVEVDTFSYEDIFELNSLEDLSIIDYIKLAASVEELEKIFIEKDTSFVVFADLINLGFKKPVLLIDSSFKSRISKAELEWIGSLTNSSQTSIRFINTNASLIDTTKSTIGREAQFILRLLDGEPMMNSNDLY